MAANGDERGPRNGSGIPDIDFLALPDLASVVAFPVGCTVLVVGGTVSMGVVEEVGVNRAASSRQGKVCYKVGRVGNFPQEDLLFAPRTPVLLSATQQNGIILGAKHEANTLSAAKYAVQIISRRPGEAGEVLTGISPSELKYRPRTVDVSAVAALEPLGPPTQAGPREDTRTRQPEDRENQDDVAAEPRQDTNNNEPARANTQARPAMPGDASPQRVRSASQPQQEANNSLGKVQIPPVQVQHADNTIIGETIPVTPSPGANDKKKGASVINEQPNPFENIPRRCGHQIDVARAEMVMSGLSSVELWPFNCVCLKYHLEGRCERGDSCTWLASHKDLTPQEAMRLEQALSPVTSARGPIYTLDAIMANQAGPRNDKRRKESARTDLNAGISRQLASRYSGPSLSDLPVPPAQDTTVGEVTTARAKALPRHKLDDKREQHFSATAAINHQPSPFQNIRVGGAHKLITAQFNMKPYLQPKRVKDSWPFNKLCLKYHLEGVCDMGKSCPKAATHQDISQRKASHMELVLAPVISADGPIYSTDSMPTQGIVNNQLNPFQRIHRGGGHRFSEAIRGIGGISFQQSPLRGICFWYHFMGRCSKGNQCERSHSHKNLSEEDARTIEQSLIPVISSTGPIIAQPSKAEKGDGGTRSCDESLAGTSTSTHQAVHPVGQEMSGRRHTHSTGNNRASHTGESHKQILPGKKRCHPESDSHHRTEKRQRNDVNSKTSTVAIGFPKELKWSPPSVPVVPAVQPILMYLPAYTFGVDFFENAINGQDGSIGGSIGEQFNCTLDLRGSALEHKLEPVASMQPSQCVLFIRIDGNSRDRLIDCARKIQRQLVQSIDRDLRAFLLYRLARLNRYDNGSKIMLNKYTDKVVCIDTFESLLDLNNKKLKYLQVVTAGAHGGKSSKIDSLRQLMASYRRTHPCRIQLVEQSVTFPTLKAFVVVFGQTVRDVQKCCNDLNQCNSQEVVFNIKRRRR